MATFFGRPVSELLGNVAKSATIGAGVGLVSGYHHAKHSGSDAPFREAFQTGAEWALSDAVVEAGLHLVMPNARSGGAIRSALVSSAIGGSTGAVEGFVSAKAHHRDDPFKEAIQTGAQWAVLDGGIELATSTVWPALVRQIKE